MRGSWIQWGAIAASLVLGVLVGRMDLGTERQTVATRDGQLVASGALAQALERNLSGENDAPLISMSYRSNSGEYCRSFVMQDKVAIAGIACRGSALWRIDVLNRTQAQEGNYQQAGSTLPAAVLAMIDQTITGDPLTLEEETAARSKGWRANRDPLITTH